MSHYINNLLSEVLDDWRFNNSNNSFSQKKFLQLVNQQPEVVLNKIFFDFYPTHPAINSFSALRRFFITKFEDIYRGFAEYTTILQNAMEREVLSDSEFVLSREARFIIKEVLILAINSPKASPQHRFLLFKNLNLLKTNPYYRKLIPESQEELLSNLPFYMEQAELLAELPDFSGVYFTAPEMAPFWNAISKYTFTAADEYKLELFLNLSRKQQILFTLANFIKRCPDISLVKKASAVYITLGEVIPWTKHPFIRRLLAVSYQEALTLIYKTK
jgi:hypothetical protein